MKYYIVASHPCSNHNISCSFMCLPRPSASLPGQLEARCVCPVGLRIMEDGVTCNSGSMPILYTVLHTIVVYLYIIVVYLYTILFYYQYSVGIPLVYTILICIFSVFC